MAFLAPVSNVTYSCEYDFQTHRLSIKAEGEISDTLNDPYFERDPTWLGGYKFNLLTTAKEEVGTPVQRHFIAKPYAETVPLPRWVETILVETASGVQTVYINRVELVGSADELNGKVKALKIAEAGKPADNVIDVLPPKDIYLPGGRTTRITADVPKPGIGLWPQVKVNTKFDTDSFELVDAETTRTSADQVSTTYVVKWKEWSELPKVFQVITTTWNGELGPGTETSRVIQPYIIHYVWIEGPEPSKK
ncbi:hypothetical protein V8F20_011974 [Naviculisporaceae sp. PSN 640]